MDKKRLAIIYEPKTHGRYVAMTDKKKGIAKLVDEVGKIQSLTEDEIVELVRDTYTAPMLKEAFLVTRLKALQNDKDKESRHEEADRLLLDYIGSDAVREAFDELDKWYA